MNRLMTVFFILAMSLMTACSTSGRTVPTNGKYPSQVVHRLTDTTTVTPIISGTLPTPASETPDVPSTHRLRVVLWNRTGSIVSIFGASGLQPSGWSNGLYFLPLPIPRPMTILGPHRMTWVRGKIYGRGTDHFEICFQAPGGSRNVCRPIFLPLKNIPSKPLWAVIDIFSSGIAASPYEDPSGMVRFDYKVERDQHTDPHVMPSGQDSTFGNRSNVR